MTQNRRRLIPGLLVVCAISLFVVAFPSAARAQADTDRDDATLVGTWRQTITFPGVPLEFFDLIVFNEDGTVIDRFGSPFDGPGLTVSIGVWKKVGRGTFAVTMENFADTDHNGLFDVRFRIRATLQIVDRNTMTGTSTIDPLSVDGQTQLAPSMPGALMQGSRMRVIRE